MMITISIWKNYQSLKSTILFYLYHYCLMGTHLHLLIKVKKESDFSNFSKRLNLTIFHTFKEHMAFPVISGKEDLRVS